MHIGLCTGAVASAKAVAGSAIDYVEENVQSLLVPEAPEADFRAKLGLAANAARPIPIANCFLPGGHKCVGPQVDMARILAYADCAFRRARESGIDTIVIGSGGARSVPEGFSAVTACEQFIDLLKRLAPLAQRHRLVLAIEPLNKGECNFINSLDEGAEAVRRCDSPNVRLLADIYHMLREGEGPESIIRHGALIAHTHIAEPAERTAPGIKGDDFRPYLAALHRVGYDRRMSLECRFADLGAELKGAIAELRRQLAEVGY